MAIWIGVEQEATFGVDPAGTQTYMDFTRLTLDAPPTPDIVYPGASGRAEELAVPGPYIPQGEIEVGVDHTNFIWFLKACLGKETHSGAADPYTHTFTPLAAQNLPSLTIYVNRSVIQHQFLGCTVRRLRLTLERGIVMGVVDIVAARDKKATIDATVRTYPAELFTARHGALTIVDDVSALTELFEVTIENAVDVEDGVRQGSRFPAEFPVAGIDVTGRVRLAFKTQAEYTRFWGGAEGPSETTAATFAIVETLTYSATRTLTITCSKAKWTRIATPITGRDRIRQDLEFRALWDVTDNVIKVVVKNAHSSYA